MNTMNTTLLALEYIIVSWQRGGILVADTQLNYSYYALVEILDSS